MTVTSGNSTTEKLQKTTQAAPKQSPDAAQGQLAKILTGRDSKKK